MELGTQIEDPNYLRLAIAIFQCLTAESDPANPAEAGLKLGEAYYGLSRLTKCSDALASAQEAFERAKTSSLAGLKKAAKDGLSRCLWASFSCDESEQKNDNQRADEEMPTDVLSIEASLWSHLPTDPGTSEREGEDPETLNEIIASIECTVALAPSAIHEAVWLKLGHAHLTMGKRFKKQRNLRAAIHIFETMAGSLETITRENALLWLGQAYYTLGERIKEALPLDAAMRVFNATTHACDPEIRNAGEAWLKLAQQALAVQQAAPSVSSQCEQWVSLSERMMQGFSLTTDWHLALCAGKVDFLSGNIMDAIEKFAKPTDSEDLAIRDESLLELGRAQFSLALKMERPECLKFTTNTFRRAIQSADPHLRDRALLALGRVYFALAHPTASQEDLKCALQYLEKAAQASKLATRDRAIFYLGQVRVALGERFGQTDQLILSIEPFSIAEKSSEVMIFDEAKCWIGRAHLALGQPLKNEQPLQSAVECFSNLLKRVAPSEDEDGITSSAKDQRVFASTCPRLGRACQCLAEHTGHETHLHSAISAFQQSASSADPTLREKAWIGAA